uniref:ZP domain-containing protein n=1 Tax=Mola mola TaxID=94237 RepID=A0A3Q4ASG1_MOLML
MRTINVLSVFSLLTFLFFFSFFFFFSREHKAFDTEQNILLFLDFNECASGENDCSQWATCTNTWASYTCACLVGFKDNNRERPGRACQGTFITITTTTSVPTATTTAPTTTITAPTTNASMLGAISVQCRGTAITVTVARDFLLSTSIRESTLYLGLLRCGVNGGNATHAQLTVAWNECSTQLVHNETYYTASVTLFNTMDQYISPNGTMEAPKIRLEVHDMFTDVIMGSGSFQVTVQLMNGMVPLPHNYSLSSEEAVVVDVSLNTSSDHIKVVINKCWATPTRNPGDSYSHIFLENSCSLNIYTKVLINGNSSTSQVSVQIFSFVNLNVIYLHCQVQICAQIGSNSCVPVSTPPPALTESEDLNTLQIVGLSCLGIGLSFCFIVAFVCLFYYQRNRIGHYNFNVKPKQDNFTYLVFNT